MLSQIKKQSRKKGISEMIGYVLLVSFIIVMSIIVYKWMETYIPRDIPECPDSVSMFIKEVKCDLSIPAEPRLVLTLKNNGRFAIAGYFIHVTDAEDLDIATIDFASRIKEGGTSVGEEGILFSASGQNDMTPSAPFNEKINKFDIKQNSAYTDNLLQGKRVYAVEIIPTRYQEVDGKLRFTNCGGGKVREEVMDSDGIIKGCPIQAP